MKHILDTAFRVSLILFLLGGMLLVAFQAFGLRGESGWFRMSVGSVSLRDIEDAFPRVRALLEQVR